MSSRGHRCRYSTIITTRRYKWIGHVLREDTTLGTRTREGKRKRGSHEYYGEDRLKMKKNHAPSLWIIN